MSGLKIAIVHPSLDTYGGAEKIILWLASALKAQGHQPTVFACSFNNQALRKLFAAQKITLQQLPLTRYVFNWVYRFDVAAWLLRNYFIDFDLINVHHYPSAIWVTRARHDHKHFPKIVWTCHEPPRSLYAPVLVRQQRLDPRFREQSDREYHSAQFQKLRDADLKAVTVVDHIIANSMYTAACVRQIYGRQAETVYFGLPEITANNPPPGNPQNYAVWVGRLEAYKNVSLLLDVCRQLRDQGHWPSGFQLKLIGQGPLASEVDTYIQTQRLQTELQRTGFVDEPALEQLLSNAAFGIYLPLDEPMGLVPMELGRYGRACLVSDCCGPSEVVMDGVTGLHAKALDADDIARKLRWLWNHPDEVRHWGAAARMRTHEKFKISNLAQALVNYHAS